MAMRHTFVAGITALALLVAPIGFTAHWNDHGPAISTTLAASTAYAAQTRPATKRPPASGGPTLTSGGTASRTTGWQAAGGRYSDMQCQAVADAYDQMQVEVAAYDAAGDNWNAINTQLKSEVLLEGAMDYGCAFTGPNMPT